MVDNNIYGDARKKVEIMGFGKMTEINAEIPPAASKRVSAGIR